MKISQFSDNNVHISSKLLFLSVFEILSVSLSNAIFQNVLLRMFSSDASVQVKQMWNHHHRLGKVGCLLLFAASLLRFPGSESLATRNTPPFASQQQDRKTDYAAARATRIAVGHNQVSQAAYMDLLKRYPDDCTAASHLAATSWTPRYQRQVALLRQGDDEASAEEKYRQFRHYLVKADYTNQHVNQALGMHSSDTATSTSSASTAPQKISHALSPIFITPAAAGTLTRQQIHRLTQTPVECLIALFLVGAVVSKPCLTEQLGQEFLDLSQSLSILYPSEVDPDRLVATVQIFPVQLQWESSSSPLYIMTDWHPRVLSQTQVGDRGEEGVMYIGPDSIGLVHHFFSHYYTTRQPPQGNTNRLLDLCTGSGIQALYGLAYNPQARATCVDLSPRALHFVLLNALLNDMDPERLQLIEGDLLSGQGKLWNLRKDNKNLELVPGEERPLLDLLLVDSEAAFDLVTANPPFLPVPPALAHRHGKFSDGGGSGEEVLRAIVQFARQVLLRPTGVLAVVSEFFLAPRDNNNNKSPTWTADSLIKRIESWWNEEKKGNMNREQEESTADPTGFLVTNEFPIDQETYATRRADSLEEYNIWMKHLETINMAAASPGFLYIKSANPQGDSGVQHCVAPRSSYGSLWTPSNPDAVAFTSKILDTLYKRE